MCGQIQLRKILLTLLCFCGIYSLAAQVLIKGEVFYKDQKIEGASVFLSETTFGTVTNPEGLFELDVPAGQYTLVVSHIGYKNVIYDFSTENLPALLRIELEEGQIALKEVVVEGEMSEEDRTYFLNQFKRAFIGTRLFSDACTLLNPEDLQFNYNRRRDLLRVYAEKPLRLRNEALGYEIIYTLEYFAIEGRRTSYLGYSRYLPLNGSKRKNRIWVENRRKAYAGSRRHFFQSVARYSSAEEGFFISQFQRVKNKNRPSEEEISKARALFRSSGRIRLIPRDQQPLNALDSAMVVLRKASEEKEMVDQIVALGISDSLLIRQNQGEAVLQFRDNLRINYNAKGTRFEKDRKGDKTVVSIILPLSQPNKILASGILEKPLNLLFEGYWSQEKIAVSLPLNYRP